jgi:hypothetical protein
MLEVLLVKLSWRKLVGVDKSDEAFFNKQFAWCHVLLWSSGEGWIPPAGLGGDGRRWPGVFLSGAGRWWGNSATLSRELLTKGLMLALMPFPCISWLTSGPLPGVQPPSGGFLRSITGSSLLMRFQVVCPRRCGDGRRVWLGIGKERPMIIFLSDLGTASARRSLACGGKEPRAPNCLQIFCVRVLL